MGRNGQALVPPQCSVIGWHCTRRPRSYCQGIVDLKSFLSTTLLTSEGQSCLERRTAWGFMAGTLWEEERKSKKVKRQVQKSNTAAKEFQKENGENHGKQIDNEAFQAFIRMNLDFQTERAHYLSVDPHQGQSPVNIRTRRISMRFYKGSRIKISSDFSTTVLETRISWSCITQYKRQFISA